jgi:hypothetical protein
MKKLLLLPVLAVLCLQACKKDEPKDNEPEPQAVAKPADYYYSLKVGNYWVYETTDHTGAVIRNDTIHIDADSLVGDRRYYRLVNSLGSSFTPVPGWVADSAGYIVNIYGGNGMGIDFTVKDTLSVSAVSGFDIIEHVTNRDTTITTPAGNFECVEIVTDFYYLNGTPPNGEPNPRRAYAYRGKGMGVIKNVYFYVSSPNTLTLQLVSYHLVP